MNNTVQTCQSLTQQDLQLYFGILRQNLLKQPESNLARQAKFSPSHSGFVCLCKLFLVGAVIVVKRGVYQSS